jgi:HSP20 family protein
MLPTRWSPFGQLGRMDPFRNIDDVFRELAATPMARQYEKTLEMRLDVSEDDQTYVVNVDMPGVRKEGIDVSIEGNLVTISAEVNQEKSRGKGKEIYSERYSGQAFRSFSLPVEVDNAKAEATYDGGVLKLVLPKKTGISAKRLPVS